MNASNIHSRRAVFVIFAGLLLASLLSLFLIHPSFASTDTYRRVNNQTIKYTSTPTTSGETVVTRYYHADKPQGVSGDPFDSSTFFWRIKAADNDAQFCEEYIVQNPRINGSPFQKFSTKRINGACEANPSITEISNYVGTGKDIFFYKTANGDINTVDNNASNSVFKKVKDTTNLKLSGTQAIYTQTEPAVSCPRLLVAYASDRWGFVAPKPTSTAQTGAAYDYYLNTLKAYGYDTSNVGGCQVSDSNDVRKNNESALSDILGGDTGFWKSGSYGDYQSFIDIKSVIKPLGNAVGDISAADLKTGAAPTGSIGGIASGKTNDGSSDVPTASSCGIDGIGWIVCPVINFLAKVSDSAFGFLADNFLQTSPTIFTTTTNPGATASDTATNATFKAWSTMRDIANIAFVLAFLIIIFSQITSVGITNYGVKKMLPRLVIAAILVNLSFIVCQIAVDISNILGYSIKGVFDSVGAAAIPASSNAANVSTFASGGGFTGLVGSVLAVAAGGALVWANLAALVPILLAGIVALIMILFILIARQAIIILLIVLSPLAFVAFLLPNTEQWFKKWQKTFTTMLMLFPVVAVVFGASSLASAIIKSTFDAGYTNPEANTIFGQIIAAAVMILPLFVIPGLLKKSLDGVGNLSTKINGLGGKLGGAIGKKGSQGYDNSALGRGRTARKQGKEEFRNRSYTRAVAGDDTSLMGRLRNRLSKGATGRTFTDAGEFAQNKAEAAAKGASERAEAKDYSEGVEAATAAQRNYSVADVANIAATGIHNGQRVTEHQRAAAIDRTMSSGGFSQRKAVLEGLAADKHNTTRELRNRAVSAAYSKGDQNIFGAGFGDQILDEGGSINSAADLASATVINAQEGHVAAEHLVQNSSATEYLVGATLASGNAVAQANLVTARDTARSTATTQAKIDSITDTQLNRL